MPGKKKKAGVEKRCREFGCQGIVTQKRCVRCNSCEAAARKQRPHMQRRAVE